MNTDNQLRDELRDRAGDIDGHLIGLDAVKQSARHTRRQHRIVTGLATAAVVAAVAIPAGFITTSGSSPSGVGPAGTSTPSVTPGGTRQVRLTTDVATTGSAPNIPYLADGAIHLPNGQDVSVPGHYLSFAQLGDGWVTSEIDADNNTRVSVLDANGSVLKTVPGGDSIAVSQDGTVAAFATDGGTIMTILAGGLPEVFWPSHEPGVQPVAVSGSTSCQEAQGHGCTIYYNVTGTNKPVAEEVDSHGLNVAVDDKITKLADLRSDGSYAGMTSATDTGSCSAAYEPTGDGDLRRTVFSTCDYTLGKYSPDGRYILGLPAYFDGLGSSSLSILDAKTGRPVAEFRSQGQDGVFVSDSVWDEGSDSVLATVWDNGWSLMRLSPDGTLAKIQSFGGNQDNVPVLFPARP